MNGKQRDDLVEIVKSSVELMTDEDALAITEICKRAVDNGIADITEQYLNESIRNSCNDK